jgi:hypothetical protein
VHLLELADKPVFGTARRPLEDRPETIEWQTRPEVLIAAAGSQDTSLAVQVALLTNRISERRLKRGRIYDGQVPAVDRFGTRDVEFARAMASFAADGVALEDRWPIPVDRPVYGLGAIRVAEQARGHDRPVEVRVGILIARR